MAGARPGVDGVAAGDGAGDLDDLYAVLGVERTAAAADIRRAFRRLALRLHPDRAGAAGTERFLRVASAYEVLGNAAARAAYDARRSPAPPARAPGRGAPPTTPRLRVITRLAAPLDTLVARGIARRREDGVLELALTGAEAALGGDAALGVPVRVPCPTCGGCAERDRLWCARCEFAGAIDDVVTVTLPIPAGAADGTTFTVHLDDVAGSSTLRVRLRVPAASAKW